MFLQDREIDTAQADTQNHTKQLVSVTSTVGDSSDAESEPKEIYTDTGKCRYPVLEPDSNKACLGGSWIVVMGTSNAQLMANTLLFMLSHEEAIPYIDFGTYNFLDFILEDGQAS